LLKNYTPKNSQVCPDAFKILISFRIEDPRFYFKIKDFDKIGMGGGWKELSIDGC